MEDSRKTSPEYQEENGLKIQEGRNQGAEWVQLVRDKKLWERMKVRIVGKPDVVPHRAGDKLMKTDTRRTAFEHPLT